MRYRLLFGTLGVASLVLAGYLYIFGVTDLNSVILGTTIGNSSISQSQILQINITLENTLPLPNNLPITKPNWPISTLSGPPCGGIGPFRLALYPGKYAFENVSQGKPVQIFDAIGYCPLVPLYRGTPYYRLGPLQRVTNTVELRGNWTGVTAYPDNKYPNGVPPFSPGVYTLFVGDSWGQIIVRYFIVMTSG